VFYHRLTGMHFRLFSLAIPMILSNITVPLLGLVDTAVIGHLGQAYFLGATSIGATIITFVTWLCGFLRMSTTGLTAQSVGQHNHQQNSLILGRGLVVALLIGLFFVVLQVPFLTLGLNLSGGSPEVQHYAKIYSEIRIYGLPAALANLVLLGWLLGNHQAKMVMWLIITTNLVNVVLDLVFVLLLHWQVAGVAWATIVSEYVSLVLGLWLAYRFLLRHSKAANLACWLNYRAIFDGRALARYFKLNRDILLRTIALQVTFVFITFQGARLGDLVVAANAILLNFLLLISFGLDGIANAAEVLVGKASGARNKTTLVQAVQVTLLWTGIFAMVYSLFFMLFGEQFIHLISSVEPVNAFALQYLNWIIWLPLIACWCYAFDGIYIGLMQAKVMRNSMLLATLGCFYPVWYLLQAWGNHGLWAALTCFMLVRGASLAWHFYWYNYRAPLQISNDAY
jgi:multidrug resistance protein, MATE family